MHTRAGLQQRHRTLRGFTLIEVMVTTGTLAILTLTTAMLWRAGASAFSTTSAHHHLSFEARRALDTVSSELRQGTLAAPEDEEAIVIAPDSRSITFRMPSQTLQTLNGVQAMLPWDVETGRPLLSAAITYRLQGDQLLREIDRPSQRIESVFVPCGAYNLGRCEMQQVVTSPTTATVIAERITDIHFSQPDPGLYPGLVSITLSVETTPLNGEPIDTEATSEVFLRNML